MGSKGAGLAVFLAVVVTGGCAGDTAPTTSVGVTTSSSPLPTSTVPPVVDCPGGGEFAEGGGIAEIDGAGSDAGRLGSIYWEAAEPCETFFFEFVTSEGAPATTVPDVEISHLESFQVIRIELGIASTVITDQLVETGLVERLYVVTRLDGGMFVDLHLVAPASVRARADASPARLVVDLRPGLVEFQGRSAIGPNVVVVSPAAEAAVDATTQFMGYSRTFESNVAIVVTQGNEVVTETNTVAADSIDTWGEFRAQLGLPPGNASVFFGEASLEDGSLEGITLDLAVS